jgi:hypothetical protein
LEGGLIVAGEGEVLAHLVVVAFVGIDPAKFLLVTETVIQGKKIVDVPFGEKREDAETGAIADGSG